MARRTNKERMTDEELSRLRSEDRRNCNLAQYARNLNEAYLQGKISKVYNREELISSVQKVLLRKSKGNVLLTGPAGCGKTAIAEGLAQVIAENRVAWMQEREKALRKCPKDDNGDPIGFVEPTPSPVQ